MLLYEGKAKKVYSTESENEFIVYFKDDATAFNGEKKAQISSKGILNNKISTIIFEMLHEEQIKTHFVKKISEREMLVKKVEILPLEVGTVVNKYVFPLASVFCSCVISPLYIMVFGSNPKSLTEVGIGGLFDKSL